MKKSFRTCTRHERVEDAIDRPNTVRTHREIADILGIGRARVFHQEQVALRKIKVALADLGMSKLDDLDAEWVECQKQREEIWADRRNRIADQPFSCQHGWLKVEQVVSLNGGSVAIEDIVLAYQYLKASHRDSVHPPVLVSTRRGTRTPYTIEAVAEHQGTMRIRCWPVANAPRTVTTLTAFTCTVIAESEFDEDDGGQFDVPILICAIISARHAAELEF